MSIRRAGNTGCGQDRLIGGIFGVVSSPGPSRALSPASTTLSAVKWWRFVIRTIDGAWAYLSLFSESCSYFYFHQTTQTFERKLCYHTNLNMTRIFDKPRIFHQNHFSPDRGFWPKIQQSIWFSGLRSHTTVFLKRPGCVNVATDDVPTSFQWQT
jgi:hypothetical protein